MVGLRATKKTTWLGVEAAMNLGNLRGTLGINKAELPKSIIAKACGVFKARAGFLRWARDSNLYGTPEKPVRSNVYLQPRGGSKWLRCPTHGDAPSRFQREGERSSFFGWRKFIGSSLLPSSGIRKDLVWFWWKLTFWTRALVGEAV